MSLGTGFEYLMASVARGDGSAASSPLTRYYAESGTPPGRFLGRGLAGLNGGAGVAAGSEVSEEALWRLLGMLADPVTGTPLGRRPKAWPATQPQERVARPVAAFDLTFSAPKSVSVLWALADADIQAVIHQAHRDAVAIALAWAEQRVFFSRSGRNGAVSEPVRGVVAAGFDHWDSRAGDPHLHTHLVVANRAQCTDGSWRSLDSRTLFRYTVALSELHEGVLADLLSERLGLAWVEHVRRHSTVPRHDVAGVPTSLIEAFSSRSRDIETTKNQLVADFARRRGRQPSTREILRLRQQATLDTRPDKAHRTLADQIDGWRARAADHIGTDTSRFAREPAGRNSLPALTAAGFHSSMIDAVAAVALETVATKRATFTHANVLAEVHRQLHGVRFASPADRLATAERATGLALEHAVLLTEGAPIGADSMGAADATAPKPRRPPGSAIYTTRTVLDAEIRLLDAGRDSTAPRVDPALPDPSAGGQPQHHGDRLGADQAAAVHAIATSGRRLDLLLGPAGAGKTTALTALRRAWEMTYGAGSVLGLAPSAAAAANLADELGIDTDNTAKWLTETRRTPDRDARVAALRADIDRFGNRGSVRSRRLSRTAAELQAERERWSLHPGQLLIIDEAGLAGTLTLDQLTQHANRAGAKVLLVGDWAQLGAIEAGGALAMLAHDRLDAPSLTEIRRFSHDWERAASSQLRVGDTAAIDAYLGHGRVHSGDQGGVVDAAFAAWQSDTDAGLNSLMIASGGDTVTALNTRAQHHRISRSNVDSATVSISGGAVAAVGDRVVTRANDRRLRNGSSWVKNGDTWTVAAVRQDGSIDVDHTNGGGKLALPASYVREHVDLGYATTTHRAQGRTVDTAHAVIEPLDTRETLYVAATRAREGNHLYVDVAYDADPDTRHENANCDDETASGVLQRVLARESGGDSAHAVLQRYGVLIKQVPEGSVDRPQSQVQRGPGAAPGTDASQVSWIQTKSRHVSL